MYNVPYLIGIFLTLLVGAKMTHDPELLQAILKVIDNDIRPALNADGGDISVVSLDGNILSVKLQGACAHCLRATITLQNAVQATLRKMVSENIEIKAV